ncbi:hypothetical protein UY3_09823 [Chelonia mydas]|uniref:Uncharacterized protein n=1 Tax=Chelonia mydas TaxID=8469 RepID=M7B536_CHEMY|nr:hypothetical protein UY3_09823 [Chelonia mydas]
MLTQRLSLLLLSELGSRMDLTFASKDGAMADNRASELRVLSRAVTMEYSGIAPGGQYRQIVSTVPQTRPGKADLSANPLVRGGVRKSILRALSFEIKGFIVWTGAGLHRLNAAKFDLKS